MAVPLSLPDEIPSRALPDLLPARMVNEFVYCPRLFYYMWVEQVFVESADTLEGQSQHARVDRPSPLPEASAQGEILHGRSVMLSSPSLRVIAKMDLVELDGETATPVDYKHGSPRETEDGSLELWPTDRVQLALQALVLRENGYRCQQAIAFYQATRQRVRVEISEELAAEARQAVREAWAAAREVAIPPPLAGSPKCGGCSLAPVCLPDEVGVLEHEVESQLSLFDELRVPARKPPDVEIRRMMSPRDERKPVYVDTPGLKIGRSGGVLQARDRESKLVQEMRISDICQLNIMGNAQVTTQAIQTLCQEEVPVCYFSQGGWFYGFTANLGLRNLMLRQRQFELAARPLFCLDLARQLIAGKIRNQRTFLMRNHVEPPSSALADMKRFAVRAESAATFDELLGLEGMGARSYFECFDGLLKGEEPDAASALGFDFDGRNRRPPRDPVNALLSLGYSMLAKDLTVACVTVGFDPGMGFLHQPRWGRPALALDLMEPLRPLIVDSAVVTAVNTRMVGLQHFSRIGPSIVLKPEGRKAFYRAYETRMDTLVTHPLFGYRVSYRRLLDIQTRLLAKLLQGEIPAYPVFTTK